MLCFNGVFRFTISFKTVNILKMPSYLCSEKHKSINTNCVSSEKVVCFEEIILNCHVKNVMLQVNVKNLNCKIKGDLLY